MLAGHVPSVAAVTSAANTRGNPNPQNIKKVFSTLGLEDILDGLSWHGMGNPALRKKLQDFNTLRNRIVLAASEQARKQLLVNQLAVFNTLATRLDAKLRTDIHGVTGTYPW